MTFEQTRQIEFSQPTRNVVMMLVVLVLVGVLSYFLQDPISTVFDANPYLNGFIIGVFVIGVLSCFWQVSLLIAAVSWLEGFAIDRPGHEFVEPPRLLVSLSALLRDRRARKSLTSTSTRQILDSVATRLDELRDITRYIVNLLILVGLLGTFWGLSNVVPGIVETMRNLTPKPGEGSMDVFNNLMQGLNSQLDGMGTAFASSLLGLAGSLVVGLLDLFTGHGHNRFYRELEVWLSSITRISYGSDTDTGGAGDGAWVAEFMDRQAEQMAGVADMVARAEEKRAEGDVRIAELSSTLSSLAEALSGGGAQASGASGPEAGAKLDRIAAAQEKIAQLLESQGATDHSQDAEARLRLRNLDMLAARILEEISAGRQDSVAEIRGDLQRLTRTILELGGEESR